MLMSSQDMLRATVDASQNSAEDHAVNGYAEDRSEDRPRPRRQDKSDYPEEEEEKREDAREEGQAKQQSREQDEERGEQQRSSQQQQPEKADPIEVNDEPSTSRRSSTGREQSVHFVKTEKFSPRTSPRQHARVVVDDANKRRTRFSVDVADRNADANSEQLRRTRKRVTTSAQSRTPKKTRELGPPVRNM